MGFTLYLAIIYLILFVIDIYAFRKGKKCYYNYTDNGCRNSNLRIFMACFINVIKKQNIGIESCSIEKMAYFVICI